MQGGQATTDQSVQTCLMSIPELLDGHQDSSIPVTDFLQGARTYGCVNACQSQESCDRLLRDLKRD